MRALNEIIKENILFAVREKTFYLPIILYIVSIVFFVINKSIFNTEMLIDTYVSLATTIIFLFTLIPILYLSISSIRKDIVNKTIYFTLKSVSRNVYLLWKIISLIIISFVLNSLFLILFYFWFFLLFWNIDLNYLYIFWLAQLEYIILILITILFSFMTSSIISSIFFIILFIFLWHTAYTIKLILTSNMIELSKFWETVINWFFYLIPNLEAFNVRDMILFNTDLAWFTIKSIGYFILLSFIISFLITRTFNKKDL